MGAVTIPVVAPVRKVIRVAEGTITVATTGGSVGGTLEGGTPEGSSRVGIAAVGGTLVSIEAGVTADIVPATIVPITSGDCVGATDPAQAALTTAKSNAEIETGISFCTSRLLTKAV